VAVLLIVMGVGLGFGNLLRVERDRAIGSEQRAKGAEGKAREAEGKAHGLFTRAVAAENEATIRSRLAQATAMRRSGQAGQRFGCLEEIAQAMRLGGWG
jgi:hypothetical protein